MRKEPYSRLLVVLMLAFVTSLAVLPNPAQAATPYDGAYRTTTSIALSNDGWYPSYSACASVDYTTTWKQALDAAPQMTSAYKASLNTALDGGRIGVSKVVTTSYGHTIEGFIVYWTEDDSLELQWDNVYSGHLVSAVGGSTFHSVLVRNKNAQTVGSDCSPYVILGGASLVSTGTDLVDSPDEAWNLFVQTDYPSLPNSPGAYEGVSIQGDAPTRLVEGTVDCGGENPSAMLITQNGVTSAASLTYVSLGISSWKYYMGNTDPYTFSVSCGQAIATAFGTVSPAPPTSNNWTCDIYGEDVPHHCVLS